MLQHFLPATYLASFSEEDTLPRRDRHIAVGDRGTGRCFLSRVGETAAINDLYILSNRESPHLVDEVWQRYERHLAAAIDELLERNLAAITWAQVLVPFVACLFVRGPDFDERFEARLRSLGVESPDDNTNRARLFELQRILAPIAGAKWMLFETIGDDSVITNDLGFAPFRAAPTGDIGAAIPLDHRHILGVVPRKEWPVAFAQGDRWYPNIQYITLDPDNHQQFNQAAADSAQRWIYGPDIPTIERYLLANTTAPAVPELPPIGFISGRELRAHEFTWHRLVSVLARPPDPDETDDFEIDYQAIASGWAPPIILPANFPMLPPALRRRGIALYVNFYNPESYYCEVEAIALQNASDHEGVIAACTKGLGTAFELRQIAKLHHMRAAAYDELDRYDLALQDFDAAIELDPSDSVIHLNRCISLVKQGRFPEGICNCTKAIELRPDLAEAYANRAIAYIKSGREDEGMADFDEAVRLLEDGPAKGTILLNRGFAHLDSGRPETAMRDFTKAIGFLEQEHPERARCYYLRAVCHGTSGRLRYALEDLDEALVADPDYRAARDLKEQVLRELMINADPPSTTG